MKINYWANLEENCCYHIYNRAIGNEILFKRDGNWDYFMEKWWKFLDNYVTTYAYCLIPNHFYFLIKVKPITASTLEIIAKENTKKSNQFLAQTISFNDFLVDQFKRFFTSYSGGFNKQNKRHGNLFQSKIKRVFIKNRAYFEYLLFYIHHNPIHHNMVKDYSGWMYSSFNIILSGAETRIARNVVLQYFADEKDIVGKQNFLLQHKLFKQNFVQRQNSMEFKHLCVD